MESPNTIVHLAHVSVADRSYNVSISVCMATKHIHIFKYNDLCCEFEIFDNESEACAFLERPLSTLNQPRLGRGSQH